MCTVPLRLYYNPFCTSVWRTIGTEYTCMGTHLHIIERVLKPRGEHAVTAQVKAGSCSGHLLAPRQRIRRNIFSLQFVP